MPGKSRRILLAIVLLLAMPFVAGTGLYLSGWHPERTANHGVFIAPPAAMESSEAARIKWQGKWSLLLIHDAPCGAPCARRLDELRRLRVSLGRNMGRTRLVWIGTAISAEAAALKAQMPDLTSLDMYPDQLRALASGSVVLVDPRGLAMMRYPPGADPKGMRADLEQLLKSVWST